MKLLFLRLLALLGSFWLRRATPGLPERVLVLKPDHLGDLLLATPALGLLRESLPDARITGLVGPWSRVMWQRNPDLDDLITLPFPGFDRANDPNPHLAAPKRSLSQTLRPYVVLLKYALLLRRERYDAALLLRDDHWWGAALIYLAGIPRRVGYDHPLSRPFLTTTLPLNPREHVTRQALAITAQLVDMVAPTLDDLTVSAQPPVLGYFPLRFEPSPADQAWARAWLAEHLAPGERLVVIHPGASGPTKQWLPERWANIANALGARPGLRILLTGGPDEVALANQVAAQISVPVLNMAGATNLGQLAALLRRASLTLGGDTGPLHIAVSQGNPTIHLFGSSDHARFGPWGAPTHNQVLSANLPCSPCSSFDFCPRHTEPIECMARIEEQQVLSAARASLDV